MQGVHWSTISREPTALKLFVIRLTLLFTLSMQNTIFANTYTTNAQRPSVLQSLLRYGYGFDSIVSVDYSYSLH